jgi:hypothetical protein
MSRRAALTSYLLRSACVDLANSSTGATILTTSKEIARAEKRNKRGQAELSWRIVETRKSQTCDECDVTRFTQLVIYFLFLQEQLKGIIIIMVV